ncbi:MAG TPA: hypothetical protein PKA82_13630 [Pyrinomonadaceae bacterium]|nr:hypothetical protein [Pyrinomonadaceae bacterium]
MKTTTTTTILIRHAEVLLAENAKANGTSRCPHCNGEIPAAQLLSDSKQNAINCNMGSQVDELKVLNGRREK